ncbi:MAG: TetR/AcrR family transcriptional regulator [Leptolyngbyaceae cyanobacterium bins.349]|nr:TetR/AcrR family transcriptional regulator [Leptolyngbyaceae cyanobacterium bins.349]
MPKIVDHDRYRQELLSQCLDVIAEKGYATITMRQIAAGLKVSTGTLYHYFPSKESLFEQLVEYISYQDTSEATIAALKQIPTRADRLVAMFNYISDNEEYFLRQTLMLMDFARPKSRDEINQNETLKRAGERYEKAIAQILEIDDPAVVILVMNLFDGLIVRRLYQGDRISIERQAQVIKAMLTTYLD